MYLDSAHNPQHFSPIHAFDIDGGRPLDKNTRRTMESRFHADFGHVRVHTGRLAAAATKALDARAFTFGAHIFFAGGEYSPERTSCSEVLAHELVHVLQQGVRGIGANPVAIGELNDPLEMEAERIAAEVLAGNRLSPITRDRSQVIRRTVTVHLSSAKITTNFTGASPDVAIIPSGPRGRPAINSHLTKNFTSGSTLSAVRASDAWTADAQVSVTATSNSDAAELSQWQFGFLQFQRINALKAVYTGRNPSDGTITIDASKPPAMPRTLGVDYASGLTLPWCRNPNFGVNLGIAKASMGDHPMLSAPSIWQNLQSGHDNFIRELHDSRTFWTQFSAQDPKTGNFLHLAFFEWNVVWRFDFQWNFTTLIPTAVKVSSTSITSSAVSSGSPAQAASLLTQMPATPILLGTPEAQRGWQQALAGVPPNRVDT